MTTYTVTIAITLQAETEDDAINNVIALMNVIGDTEIISAEEVSE